MTFVLLWLLCGVVAAIIGSKRGLGCAGLGVGILFGPFGILITYLSKGNRKACPHCKELIHWEATVCPRCTQPIDSSQPSGEPAASTSYPQEPTASAETEGPTITSSVAQLNKAPRTKPPPPSRTALGLTAGIILLCVLAVLVAPHLPGDQPTTRRSTVTRSQSSRSSGWCEAPGNLWRGVKLYYGPTKFYVGEVLGGNDHYVSPFTGKEIRGVKIRYPSGSEEWKDRSAMVIDGRWYIKCDDPALARMDWEVYQW